MVYFGRGASIMSKKRGFTLIELLVVIAVIAILMAILMPALSRAKEAGQRAVCMGNLKSITLSWTLYASDNGDKMVCGEVYSNGVDGQNSTRNGEPYWCGDDTAASNGTTLLPIPVQESAIQSGALYPYIKTLRVYHCPAGVRGEVRNYAFVDSMNGFARPGTSTNGTAAGSTGIRVGKTVLWCKKTTDIVSPPQAQRMCLGDEGRATTDTIATQYTTERWYDPAQARHGDGNTYSFADGHVEYWKWRGAGTIRNAKTTPPGGNYTPQSDDDFKDLYKFQIAVWGRLGYVPSHPF
jgi:prepilin-type N-terminal cleavage/methylation domain-containing protein/prepilin-type processing-associated H-X9-DG protein